ncbi:cell division protein SepF [Candidatus Woesearchaeota archaeon]|nr:cell division protein SepF [Candidatus Woesearchaeota archaeon]
MGFFSKVKEAMAGETSKVLDEAEEEGYVELGAEHRAADSKIIVRPFILHDFESIKPILDCLRDGNTVALVNIRSLKDKDLVELKRAINKLKKTCDAIEGDIAGFGDDWIAAVPSFAKIHRAKKEEGEPRKKVEEVTEYSSEEAPREEYSSEDEGEPKIETY